MKQRKQTGRAARRAMVAAQIAGEMRRARRVLLATTALQATAVLVLAFPVAAQPAATARPTGGAVVAGQASINQNTAQTTVQQSSQRAAIDWRSYDIGSAHTVQYNQPNASAIVLNRVTGPDPSQIAGRIQANGQVVITNQSGVTFFRGSQVDVQSLVVSSAGVTNQNFMAGKMIFDQGGKPDAKITNAGNITVAATGLAALVAPQVANSGVITAKMGHVVLAGGAEAHTVDLYGDGLMSVDVTRQVTRAPNGATSLVTNSGVVNADGGTVVLSARAADGIMTNLVTNTGRVQANTAGGKPGTIVMSAVGGTVSIEGTVAADGRAPGATGGTIVATATEAVNVGAGARVSANGRGAGGTIALGTTAARAQVQSGGVPADAAKAVTVAAGAKVSADGKGTGSGGTIALLSTQQTTMAGRLTARGGTLGGDGGRVEVSGNTLRMSGTVDATAPRGKIGTLTLDPVNLVIGGTSDPGGNDSYISAATFNGLAAAVNLAADSTITLIPSVALNQANAVTLTSGKAGQGGGTITVNVSLTAPSVTLNTIDVGGIININAGVTATSGNLTLNTGSTGSIALGAAIAANGSGVVTLNSGSVSQTSAGAITAGTLTGTVAGTTDLSAAGNVIVNLGSFTNSGGAFSLNDTGSGTGLTISGALNAAGQTVTIRASSLTQTGAGAITASTLAGTVTGTTDLTAAGNAIANLGAFSNTGGAFSLNDTGSGSGLILTGALNATGQTVNLRASSLTQTGSGAITATTLTGTVTGTTDLTAAGNAITNLGAFSNASGAFSLNDTGSGAGLTLTGALNATGQTVNLRASSLGQTGTGAITAGTLTGTVTGTTDLTAAGNAITNLGAFSNTSGAFSLNDTGSGAGLTLTGALNATGQTVNLRASSLGQTGTGAITAATLTGTVTGTTDLTAAGNAITNLGAFSNTSGAFSLNDTGSGAGLTLTGALNATGQTVTLQASSLGQTGAGAITAGTLAGTVTGVTNLTAAGNAITNLGAFSNTSGAFSLNDTGSATGLNISGALNAAGQTVSLSGSSLTEGAGGTIAATTLTGSSTGAVALTNSGNAIGTLGAFTGSTSFALTDGTSLTANTALTTTGQLTLRAGTGNTISVGSTLTGSDVQVSAGTVTLGVTSTLAAGGAGHRVQLDANTLNLLPGATVSNASGTVAYAPLTAQAMTVDATTFAVLAPGLNTPAALILGSTNATPTAGNATATSLTLNGLISANPATLALYSSGAVTQTGTLVANTVSGGAASLTLTNGLNTITALGPFTGGALTVTNAASLNVTGPINATGQVNIGAGANTLNVSGAVGGADVRLTANTLAVTAGVTGGGAGHTVALDANTLTVGAGGSVTNAAGTVAYAPRTASAMNVSSALLTTLAPTGANAPAQLVLGSTNVTPGTGNATATSIALAGGTVGAATLSLYTTGTVTQSGALTAGAVAGASTGAATLTDAGNAISGIAGFTTGGTFALTSTTSVTVSGALSATGAATVTTGAANTITASAAISGADVRLTAGTLALSSSVTAGGAGHRVVFDANTLTALAGGAVSNAGGTVAFAPLSAGALTVDSAALAFLAPTGASAPATLVLGSTNITPSAGNATATSIQFNGGGTVGAATLSLFTTGSISQTGALTANTLNGAAGGAVTLANTGNAISTLAGFTLTGNPAFTLLDSVSLTVSGAVSTTGNVVVGTNAASTLTVNAGLTGGNLRVSGGTVALGAALGAGGAGTTLAIDANTLTLNVGAAVNNASGTVAYAPLSNQALTVNNATLAVLAPASGPSRLNLGSTNATPTSSNATATSLTFSGAVTANPAVLGVYSSGDVNQTGALTAGTLTGSAGSVTLTNTGNAVTALGSYTGGALALTDGTSLTVAGPVNSTGQVTLATTAANSIAVNGTVAGSDVRLSTGTLNLASTVTAGGAGHAVALDVDNVAFAGGAGVSNAGGTVAVAPLTSGRAMSVDAATQAGRLSLTPANITTLTASTPAVLALGSTNATPTAGNATASSLAINAATTVGAPRLGLYATGAITQTAALTVGALTGAAGTSATLNNAGNLVADLGAFSAGNGGFTFVDSRALNVSGAVSATTTAAITSAGSMTIPGSVTAPTVTLTATTGTLPSSTPGDISISGTASGAQVNFSAAGALTQTGGTIAGTTGVNLQAGGAISQTGGTITGGLLTGQGTSVSLTQGGNAFATLGNFSATSGALTVVDGRSLTVSGAVSATTAASISSTGSMTVSGSVNGPTVTLTATVGTLPSATPGDISISGTASGAQVNVSAAGALTQTGGTIAGTTGVNLQAGGAISQTGGTITGGLLTGQGTSVSLTQGGNAFATLGNFSATSGALTVVDGRSLTVSGAVSATTAASISSTGSMTVSGSVNAPTVTLTATVGTLPSASPGDISIGGTASGAQVNFSAAGALTQTGGTIAGTTGINLQAGGAISQTGGTITGGLLTGQGTSVSLTQGGNAFATLGNFSATSGALTVVDGRTLTVSGAVSATTAASISSAGSMTVSGSVNAPTVTLTATVGTLPSASPGDISIGGTASGAQVNFSAAGALTQTGGTIAGTTGVNLQAGGAISQTGGTITGGLLTGQGTSVSLTQGGNAFATLGNFSATSGALTVVDGRSLTVSGAVSATTAASISSTGSMTVSGSVNAPTVTLTAIAGTLPSSTPGDISISGTASGAQVNFSAAGALTQTGGTIAGTTGINLQAGGAISQTGGTITGGLLTGQGTSVSLTQTGNAFATLGNFSATSGALAVVDGRSLTVSGAVSAITAASISSAGSMTVSGSVNAPTVTLTATVGTLPSATPGDISISGTASGAQVNFSAAGALTQTGGTIAGTTGVSLQAGGAISQTGGTITGGLLTGQGTSVSLTQTGNAFATLGNFSATSGALTVVDGRSLTVSGAVSATTAASISSTGSMTVSGSVNAPTVTLTAIAGTLPSSTPGDISISGTASGAQVNFSAAGALTQTGGTIAGTTGINLQAGGAISQTGGTITGGLLTGQGTSVSLTQTGNAFATLGNFSATSSALAVVDGRSLTVSGAVSAITAASISSAGSMTVSGSVNAPTVTLTATVGTLPSATPGDISISGTASGAQVNFSAAGALTQTGGTIAGTTGVSLQAGGAISQTGGTITTGLLTGQGSSALLTQAGNAITTLGGFTATTGSFTLRDSVALTVNGPVAAASGTVSITDAGLLTVASGVPVTITGRSVSLSATTMAISGTIGACVVGGIGGDITLATTGGTTITGAGAVVGGRSSVTITGGTTLTSGLVDGPTLSFSGGLAQDGGSIAGTGITINGGFIQTAGTLWSGGAFTTTASSIAGTVAAAGTITLSGVTGISGTVASEQSVAITTPGATNLALSGNVIAKQNLAITQGTQGTAGTGGGITQTAGQLVAGGTARLYAADGAAAQTGGTLAAANVSVVSLAGDNNFTPSQAAGISGTIGAPTTFLCPGCIGSASPGAPGTLGVVLAGQPVSVRLDGVTLTLARAISGNSVELHSTGDTTVTGLVTAGTLTGTSGYARLPGVDANGLPTYDTATASTAGSGSTTLSNTANNIAAIDTYLARSGFTLVDAPASGLTLTGTVRAGLASDPLTPAAANAAPMSITLTGPAGSLAIGAGATNGTLAGGTVTLNTSGAITETTGSRLVAANLTGAAPSVALPGANQVGTLDSFTATTGGFQLTNTPNLIVAGPVNAANGTVSITDSGTITVAANAAPATINGRSVALSATSMAISGDIGACVVGGTGGDITLNASSGGITLAAGKTIGGQSSVTMTAVGGVTVGGTVNAPTLSIGNGLTVTTGGIVFANSATVSGALALTGGTVHATTLNAGSIAFGGASDLYAGNNVTATLTTDLTGQILSGGTLNLSAPGDLNAFGTAVSLGALSLNVGGAFTQTTGIIAGDRVTIAAGGTANQTGGRLAANGLLQVSSTATAGSGSFSGMLAATNFRLIEGGVPVSVTPAGLTGPPSSLLLNIGTPAFFCPGCTGPLAPSFTATATVGAGTGPNGTLRIDGATITLGVLGDTVIARNIELHSTGDTTAPATIIADTLTGTAGYARLPGLDANGLPTYDTATTSTGGSGSATFGTATNNIGAITGYLARSGFTLVDAPTAGLTLTGTVRAGLASDPLTATAPNAAPVSITLTGPAGNLAIGAGATSGTLAGSTVTLNTSGAITETTGSLLVAANLTGTAPSVSLPGANRVDTLGLFTATTGDFTLVNTPNLTIAGPVNAANGTVSITDGGTIIVAAAAAPATINGRSVALSATSMAISGDIGACVVGGTGGDVTLTATSGGISLAAGKTIGAQSSVTMTAVSGVTVAGTVDAPTLSIGSGLTVDTGGFVFGDTVTVAGGATVNGGTLHGTVLNAGTVTFLGGDLFAGNDLAITVPASLSGRAVSRGNLSVSGSAISSSATFLSGSNLAIQATGDVRQVGGTFGGASSVTLTAGGVFDQSAAGLITSGGQIRTTASGSGSASLLGTFAGPVVQISEPGVALTASPTLTGAGTVSTGGLANVFHCPGCEINIASSPYTASGIAGTGSPTTLRVDGLSLTLGALAATNVELHSVGSTNANGVVTAASLTGTAGYGVSGTGTNGLALFTPGAGNAGTGAATFGANNAVTRIDGYVTRNGFTLVDTTALTLGGTVRSGLVTDPVGAAMANAAPIAITVNGAGLNIGDSAAPGTLLAGSVVALNTTGPIVEQASSAIATAALTGAASAVVLPGPNQVATIAGFVAPGGFLLNDGTTALTVTGGLNAGTAIVNLAAGSLSQTAAGVVTAGLLTGTTSGSTNLTATNNNVATVGPFATGGDFGLTDGVALQLVGALNAGTNTVLLNAASLSQSAAGVITAGTLRGTVGGTTNLSTAVNAITNLGPFTNTGGNFSLNDGGQALTVTGAVNAGSNAVSITAGSLSQTSAGVVTAGLLTGSTAGLTDLTTATNNVATVGPFTTGGDFGLTDGAALRLVGALNAGGNTVTLNAPSLSQSAAGIITAGTLRGTVGGTTDLSAAVNAIANLGPFTNTGGNFSLNDGARILTLTGALNAGGNTVAITTGALSQTASGKLTATVLTGRVAGTTNLGAVANAVANIGAYTSGSDFTLTNGSTPLNILGTLNAGTSTVTLAAGSVSQSATGSITAGALVGSTAGAFDLGTAPNAIATLARLDAGGNVTLNDGTTGLTITGPLNAIGNTVAITAATLSQTAAGVVTAATLTGATTGTTDLGTAINVIGTLGTYTVAGGDFRLNDGTQALALAGNLNVGSGTAAINAGSFTETGGLITAGTLTGATTGDALLTLGNNTIAKLDAFNADGRFSLVNGPDLAVTGAVRGGGTSPNVQMVVGGNLAIDGGSLNGNIVTLQVAGTITERNNGQIVAGTLNASAAQIDANTASNSIGTLGTVTGTRGVRIADAAALTVGGSVQSAAGDVTLAGANGVAVPGTIDGGVVTVSAGSGSLTSSGTVTARNAIAFRSGATATLSGTERAPLITVTAPAIQLQGGTIVVGGVPQPSGIKVDQLPKVATATTGLFLEAGNTFLQTGTTSISPGFGANEATVRIDLTSGGGTATFGTLFSAPRANLIVDIGTGSIPFGNIDVLNLFVIYSGTAVGAGSVNLSGNIGGQSGTAAASAAQISPAATQNFRINSCALSSVNCVVLRPSALPVGNPLKELSLSFFREQDDDSELVVPNVSDQGL